MNVALSVSSAVVEEHDRRATLSSPSPSQPVNNAEPSPSQPVDNAELVSAAAGGDQSAWDALVERYAGLVWAVARGFRLDAADAADVTQATWLRLVEHLGQLRDPAALGAWLATTTRREAISLIRKRREVPFADTEPIETPDEQPAPWHHLVVADRDHELWQAFRRLPARCQTLLRLLVIEPVGSYASAAAALAMPIGALGPTRGRCLTTLRDELRRATSEEGGSR